MNKKRVAKQIFILISVFMYPIIVDRLIGVRVASTIFAMRHPLQTIGLILFLLFAAIWPIFALLESFAKIHYNEIREKESIKSMMKALNKKNSTDDKFYPVDDNFFISFIVLVFYLVILFSLFASTASY